MGRRNILVTGGCGFIGKALSLGLVAGGHRVRVLDNLSVQVHGPNPDLAWLEAHAIDLIKGSVCDPTACDTAVAGMDCVVHLAAETGTGQSMYELRRCVDVNATGTATVLEACCKACVKKFVLSSSRAIFGEGLWNCAVCGPVHPGIRVLRRTTGVGWNPTCPRCGSPAESMLPTPEDTDPQPVSVYGMTKLAQEQLVTLVRNNTGMDVAILRFFNVFGPGQSLRNAYTGVLGVFVNRARAGRHIDVYEDGNILRDFVHIDDVVDATKKAIGLEGPVTCNIGSGKSVSIGDAAREIIALCRSDSEITLTGKTRAGDVRGLVADIAAARKALGWEPRVDFRAGLETFVRWALASEYEDHYDESLKELSSRGLYH
ncbi:MAG: NAD-dependent epimerase/dehydratase family protein [Deltaproteobacteria bacterium]|nr:NAD-dependent epimerase/dehydratase family protein [Deltaproteobacteria bacterium]